jgi:hypothetical protein
VAASGFASLIPKRAMSEEQLLLLRTWLASIPGWSPTAGAASTNAP